MTLHGGRTPLNGGPLLAAAWIAGQVILWAGVVAATLFLSLVLVALLAAALDPSNWKGGA